MHQPALWILPRSQEIVGSGHKNVLDAHTNGGVDAKTAKPATTAMRNGAGLAKESSHGESHADICQDSRQNSHMIVMHIMPETLNAQSPFEPSGKASQKLFVSHSESPLH